MNYKRDLVFKFAFDFSDGDPDDERKALRVKLDAFCANEVADPLVDSATYERGMSSETRTYVKIKITGADTLNNRTLEARILNALEGETPTFDSYVVGSFTAASVLYPSGSEV